MKRREFRVLRTDLRLLRPAMVMVLVVIVLAPSLVEMATQGLSALAVLIRLAESVIVIAALVWLLTALVLRYARIQAGQESADDPENGVVA